MNGTNFAVIVCMKTLLFCCCYWISFSGIAQEEPFEIIEPPVITEEEMKRDSIYEATRLYDWMELKVKPSFPGGEEALMEFISENTKYPQEAQDSVIGGTVVVEVIIEKDGSFGDVNIVRSIHPSLDREVKRMVGTMPKWEPGVNYKDVIVRSKSRFPVRFVID